MPELNREEIAKLEALYANNPGGRVFTHLAEAYRKSGELDKARQILEDGLSRHADYASAHVVLGRVLQDQGEVGEAAREFRRVLELDPENRIALRSLADGARVRGDTTEALDFYHQLQALDRNDEEVEQIVAELSQAPAAVEPDDRAAAAESESAPATLEFEAPVPEPVSGFEIEQALEPASAAGSLELEPISGDFSLEWPEPPATSDVLPGDLGQLAPAPLEAEPLTEGEFDLSPAEFSVDPAAEEPTELPPEAPTFEAAAAFEVGFLDVTEAAEPASGDELGEADLPTETLAELYRSQGFHDRAAEVYRALLKQRPGDEQLATKLREVELRGEPDPDESAPVMPADSWLEHVESAFTGSGGLPTGAPTPYAWDAEAAEEAETGQTLGEYLRELVSWRPTQTTSLAGVETGGVLDHDADSGPAVVLDQVETVGLLETEPPEPEPAAPAVPEPEPEPESAPWTASEPAAPDVSAAAAAPPSASAGNAVEDEFEAWFGGDEEPAAPAVVPPLPAAPTPPVGAPVAPAGTTDQPAGISEEGAEADEDLEMFRSWLQSLKK